MKYLVMICRGHVPVIGRGDQGAPINKDIKPFLLYFLPKGRALDWHTMNVIVKGFHLAFKGMETEEIYDILMEQLVLSPLRSVLLIAEPDTCLAAGEFPVDGQVITVHAS